MSEVRQNYLNSISYLLTVFPCVLLLGARQVGKTTLLKSVRPGAPFLDLEKQNDFHQVTSDPDFLLSRHQAIHPNTCLTIDEAQLAPSLFSALRVAIDRDRSRCGQFLLSGSSSPELTQRISETLAGRVAIIKVSGFSLEEFYQKEPSTLFQILQAGDSSKLFHLPKRYTLEELLEACLIGSYPEPVTKRKDRRFVSLWMENYFETYIKRDVWGLFPGIQLPAYQRFIQALAHSSGQILNASNFARAIDVSQPTIKSYLKIAEGTFLWRNLESYDRSVTKRVSKMPKGHLRDTGLLNYFLRNFDVSTLSMHPQAGNIWEGFIIEQLMSGFAQRLIPVNGFYYRTHNQAEIDLILEGEFGTLPVEIKFGTTTDLKKLNALDTFVREHRLPYGIVINNADRIEWLKPKILQLPANFL
jgi:predicted AAA+ superfamily ATPase